MKVLAIDEFSQMTVDLEAAKKGLIDIKAEMEQIRQELTTATNKSDEANRAKDQQWIEKNVVQGKLEAVTAENAALANENSNLAAKVGAL